MNLANQRLIRQIEENAKSSDAPALEQRLVDFSVWYYQNIDRIDPNNQKKHIEFLHKCIEIQTEIMALMMERFYQDKARSNIIVPHLAWTA